MIATEVASPTTVPRFGRRGSERERIVAAHLPRIASLARRFRSGAVETSDLVQEGSLALLEAQARYDPERGVPLWAYAAPWVHGAMSALACDQRFSVRLPAASRVELARLRRNAERLSCRGGNPGTARVAEATGIPPERAERLLAAGQPPRSLNESVGPDADGAELVDLVADPSCEGGFDRVFERRDGLDPRQLLEVLSEREREVVLRRFGLDAPSETLADVGRSLGVTRERVRQIEARALGRLREAATEQTALCAPATR